MPRPLTFIFLLSLSLISASVCAQAQPGFVGANQCRQCHASAYTDWQQSDHAKAMQVASDESVLGDFSGVEVIFHAITSRFYKADNTFFIETLNAEGKAQKFPVQYTFGYYPLQQYLVEIENGKLQALNIAWDSRSKEEGGQRWYHLQPDENITPEHPFFWAGHFQNWNSRCAECHVTDYQKNYSTVDLSYDSTWSEGNVACEACHGPGSAHMELARKGQLNKDQLGFSRSKPTPLAWQYESGDPIANPSGTPSDDHLNMCARCHSLRMPLAENKPNADFHDVFRLQLLNEGSYFADGQIQDEVFVIGSFLQSKMHQNGVTCANCHNPHTGKIKIEGNGLCAQCHLPAVYDTQEHHNHPQASSGAQCVNCHMPERTYMGVDERRDHNFTIPRPRLSAAIDAPNACTGCHTGKDNQWAADAVSGWGGIAGSGHWGSVNHRARNLDALASESLIAQVVDDANAAVVRATLTAHLGALGSQEGLLTAASMLDNEDPLLRRAAVAALRAAPVNVRWQVLAPHMQDVNRTVRFEIAESLAEVYVQLPEPQRAGLYALLQEYRQSLSHTLDSPSTQLNLAGLEMALGNRELALQAYNRALEIVPAFVPALVNLSEFHRAQGDGEQAEQLLKRALVVAPDSAAVQHAYGLHLVRLQDYAGALGYLKEALVLADAQPRHAYVYAVALESRGNAKEAISVLVGAAQRWPNQYDLLMTLVAYMDKAGNSMSINKYLNQLNKIAPESPQVRNLSRKYGLLK